MSVEQRTPRKSNIGPGIYVGKVVNHLDTSFMGGIEVAIAKKDTAGAALEFVQCKYASPFFGATPFEGLTDNSGYEYTQKSYGFWAVPPDVGTQVIVVMAEGDYSQAYWIACVPDSGMNFMTPGYSHTTYNDTDTANPAPVGEYNKRVDNRGNDPTKFIKPANTTALDNLKARGLEKDWARGTNTSSARREAPSMVFGWSTPGPPDRTGPTVRYGKPGGTANVPFNRLGGSSFVMDDGDMSLLRKKPAADDKPEYVSVDSGETGGDVTLPANDLVRIQTRAGHQILLHNTEDLIYIAHGSGNSWIEMTANGKIDIYAKDSISVRSENDINFTADRDINFEAGNNFNFTAGQNFFLTTGNNWELKAGADGKLTAASKTHINSATHAETAPSGIFMNSSNSASVAEAASLPVRIPEHEPWPDHENLNPQNFLPEKTEAVASDSRTGTYSNGTTAEAPPMPTVPDTFKRPVRT